MAQRLNMFVPGYGRIERNEVDVSIERTHQIADIFGISLTELISFDEKYIFNTSAQITNGGLVANGQFHNLEFKAFIELIEYLKLQLKEKDELIRELVLKK